MSVPGPANPEILPPADLVALLGDGADPEAVGPFAGRPLVAVSVDSGDVDTDLSILRRLPCVAVGVHRRGRRPDPPDAFDVLLTVDDDPPAPWVGHYEGPAASLAELAAAVHRCPIAAVTLVQLLRFSEGIDQHDGLIAESLAYSSLQAGPEFGRWLAGCTRPTPVPATEPVLTERDGGRLIVTLNRPAVHNAFSAAMRDGLVEALRMGAADPAVAEIHLRGAGRSFCSGGDLTEFGTAPDPATAHLVRTTRSPAAWLSGHRARITAHVHGACRGAGVELPAFADRVTTAPDATFGLPEVAMGLVPGAGGTVSIPRRIGRQRTAFLALTGEVIDASTAVTWGLVDEVVYV